MYRAVGKVLIGAMLTIGLTTTARTTLGYEQDLLTRVAILARSYLAEANMQQVRVGFDHRNGVRRVAVLYGTVRADQRQAALATGRQPPGTADARWADGDATQG